METENHGHYLQKPHLSPPPRFTSIQILNKQTNKKEFYSFALSAWWWNWLPLIVASDEDLIDMREYKDLVNTGWRRRFLLKVY